MSNSPLPPPPPPSSAFTSPVRNHWPSGVADGIKILSIIAAVVWGLFGIAVLNRLLVLQDVRNETFGDDIVRRAADADSFVRGTAGLGLVLGIALAILLMIWLFRTTKLLRLRGYSTRYRPGWAIGGAFIPIAQFIIIYQMLSDCRRALSQLNGAALNDRYLSLPWWWGLQTAAILVGQTLGNSDSEEISDLITEEYIRLGLAVGLIGGVILAAVTFDRFRSDYRQIENF